MSFFTKVAPKVAVELDKGAGLYAGKALPDGDPPVTLVHPVPGKGFFPGFLLLGVTGVIGSHLEVTLE